MNSIKKLSLFDSSMIVMGSMIGSGIFIVSSGMARDLGSPMYLILAWVVTAILTLLAALSYGELAASMPKAGGQYVYLKEAYGPLFGFLYGWTLFTVIQSGTIAAVAVAFAKFSAILFPVFSENNVMLQVANFKISAAQILGIVVIWTLSLSNFREIKSGALIQNIFTSAKIIALVFVIIAGLYFVLNHAGDAINSSSNIIETSPGSSIGVFCAALVGSIFSSDAWNNITFTASEIDKPEKNVPRSLLIGTGSVLLIYILINLIYVNALPFEAIKNVPSDRVGTLLMQTVFGDMGSVLMAVLIMVSTFGCINGLCLSGARVYFAMAKDQLFFKQAEKLNKNQSPQYALIIQAIWASLLTLSGSYGDLLDYVVFAVLLFYILTVSALFVLRKKQADLPRPYKVFAYPYLPALYIIMASVICVSLLIYKPNYTYPGLAIVLAGIPVYFGVRKR
jgi:APA family basic amino acid/polyamine antiporter